MSSSSCCRTVTVAVRLQRRPAALDEAGTPRATAEALARIRPAYGHAMLSWANIEDALLRLVLWAIRYGQCICEGRFLFPPDASIVVFGEGLFHSKSPKDNDPGTADQRRGELAKRVLNMPPQPKHAPPKTKTDAKPKRESTPSEAGFLLEWMTFGQRTKASGLR